MNKAISLQLTSLCDTIPAKLKLIPEEEFGSKPFANKWSKKELLGHLIDSAANNHQRFVRASLRFRWFIIIRICGLTSKTTRMKAPNF